MDHACKKSESVSINHVGWMSDVWINTDYYADVFSGHSACRPSSSPLFSLLLLLTLPVVRRRPTGSLVVGEKPQAGYQRPTGHENFQAGWETEGNHAS